MKKQLVFIAIVILPVLTLSFSSNPPKWVKSFGTETDFNGNEYITGFGISEDSGNNSKSLESARAHALRDAAGMIKTGIVSTLELEEKETNDDASSMAKMNIQTTVNIELSGIDAFENYFDKKDGRYYALCAVNKSKFYNNVAVEKKSLYVQFMSKLGLIGKYIDGGDNSRAGEEYIALDALLDKLNQDYLVMNYLKNNGENLDELFNLYKLKADIYNKLKSTGINNFDDLARAVLKPFDSIDLRSKTFLIVPAYYKATTISSEFFNYLREYCALSLEKKGGKDAGAESNSPDYIFKGSFYDTAKGYKILYALTDSKTGQKTALSEVDITKEFADNSGLKMLPDNMEIALSDNKIFSQADEGKSGVELRVWTNKGTDNLVFKNGEDVNFYVTVNRSGYISILYHLAGKERLRTPLIENYYIPPEMICKAVKIEPGFEVFPPFGSETAQVFFSTLPQEKFQTITTTVDGEEYNVLAGDYKQFIINKRGLKSINKEEKAEAYVTITTIEK